MRLEKRSLVCIASVFVVVVSAVATVIPFVASILSLLCVILVILAIILEILAKVLCNGVTRLKVARGGTRKFQKYRPEFAFFCWSVNQKNGMR